MKEQTREAAVAKFEWQTVLLIASCYLSWFLLLVFSNQLHIAIWLISTALIVTLFLSITHEVVHGHPTRNKLINSLMVLLPIGWSFPYERFRDTHLDHHHTGELTDPFDDPESWYLAHYEWLSKNKLTQLLLVFNNTLFGRMLIGPILGLSRFYVSELFIILKKREQTLYLLAVWAKHLFLCTMLVVVIQAFDGPSLWQWLLAVYLGHSFLLVRTFLEHQAAEDFGERTVIIERNCPIAFLFLFNNLHFIHHSNPGIPWYQLPAHYRENRERYHAANNYYVYNSYSEIFRKYFFHAKEPVSHPFLHAKQ